MRSTRREESTPSSRSSKLSPRLWRASWELMILSGENTLTRELPVRVGMGYWLVYSCRLTMLHKVILPFWFCRIR